MHPLRTLPVPMTLALVALVVFGCGKSDKDEDLATFMMKDVEGLWSIDCAPSQLGQISGYRVAVLQTMASGGFIYENTHYEDDQCTVKLYDESSKGAFVLGDAVDAESKKVTLSPAEGTGTARHDAVLIAFNAVGACGFKDWTKDVPKDLMGTGCIGWSEVNATDAFNLVAMGDGTIQMQIYALSGDGTKNRYAGDDFTKE